MNILNNKYILKNKINYHHINIETYLMQFFAESLEDKKKYNIYFFEKGKDHNLIFEYAKNNIEQIVSIKNRALIKVIDFGRVDNLTIDFHRGNKNLYYYITERVDFNKSIRDYKFNQREILDIYIQISEFIEYIEFVGIEYKYLNPSSIYVFKENNKIKIKILDLISIRHYDEAGLYNFKKDINYLAPELINLNEKSDNFHLFSFGAFMFKCITGIDYSDNNMSKILNDSKLKKTNDFEYEFINKIIKHMVRRDIVKRFKSIYEVNKSFKKLFNIKNDINNKGQLENLNFNIKLVGRDKEYNKIKLFSDNKNIKKTLLRIKGIDGIGKSKIINTFIRDERLYARKVINISFETPVDDNCFYKTGEKILNELIDFVDPDILNYYITDLAKFNIKKIARENIIYDNNLYLDKEIPKLIDRLSNFIVAIKDLDVLIFFQNIQNSNQDIINFISYLNKLIKMREKSIKIIISNNLDNKELNYSNIHEDETIIVENLDSEAMTEFIRLVLNWNKRPINLTERLEIETGNIPKNTILFLDELFKNKGLYIDYSKIEQEISWKIKDEIFLSIQGEKYLDKRLINLVRNLNNLELSVLRLLSCFKNHLLLIDTNILSKQERDIINDLIERNILSMETKYGNDIIFFNNKSLKNYIYNNTPLNERKLYHEFILNDIYNYKDNELVSVEEIAFHLIALDKRKESLPFLLREGIKMEEINIKRAITYFKWSNSIIEKSNSVNINILYKIGKNYEKQDRYKYALAYLKKASEIKGISENVKLYISNIIAKIYIEQNKFNLAEKILLNNISISKKNNYIYAEIESGSLLSQLYLENFDFDKLEYYSYYYLPKAKKIKNLKCLGILYNMKGIVRFFKKEYEEALILLNKSIDYFKKANLEYLSYRPTNNIGSIYKTLNNIDMSQKYFEKALDLVGHKEKSTDYIKVLNNIGDNYIKLNNIYKSINIYEEIIKKSIENNFAMSRFLAYLNMTNCYIKLENYKTAYEYLRRAEVEVNSGNKTSIQKYYYLSNSIIFYGKIGCNKKVLENYSIIKENYTDYTTNPVYGSDFYYIEKYYFIACKENKLDIDDNYLFNILTKEECEDGYAKIDVICDYIIYLYSENDLIDIKKLYEYMNKLINNYLKEYKITNLILEDKIKLVKIIIKDLLNEDIINDLNYLQKNSKSNSFTLLFELNYILAKKYYEIKLYSKSIESYLNSIIYIKMILNNINYDSKSCFIKALNKTKILGGFIFTIKKYINIDSYILKRDQESYLDIISSNDFFEYIFNNIDNIKKSKYFKKNSSNYITEDNYISLLGINYNYNINILLNLIKNLILSEDEYIFEYKEDRLISSDLSINQSSELFLECLNNNKYIMNTIKTKKTIFYNELINQCENMNLIKKDIKAMFIIPILLKDYTQSNDFNYEKRKKDYKSEKIIGILVLRSNSPINKFTKKSLEKLKNISNLIAINIQNKRLKNILSTDKLTMVYTRKYIENKILDSISINKEFSIIMCDIDHFKLVNDKYGHIMGDEVLYHVAQYIKSTIKKAGLVGRYGGEEFIIYLDSVGKYEAFKIADGIRSKIENSIFTSKKIKLTISLGISSFPKDGFSKVELIEKADQSLYYSKDNGRNKVTTWQKRFKNKAITEDKLAGIISGNIVNDQRNVLVLVELSELINSKNSFEKKISIASNKLLEIILADNLYVFDNRKNKSICIFKKNDFKSYELNKALLKSVIKNKKGMYIIDWENTKKIDKEINMPDWQSVMVIPLIKMDKLVGTLYFTISSRIKEYDYYDYNIARVAGNIIGNIFSMDN